MLKASAVTHVKEQVSIQECSYFFSRRDSTYNSNPMRKILLDHLKFLLSLWEVIFSVDQIFAKVDVE